MKAKLATCFTLAATMFVATTAAADKLPDPVSIEITSPADATMFEGAPATIDVVVDVSGTADDIELFVDDVSVAQAPAAPPWTFADVELAEGMHTLRAVANLDGLGYGSPIVTVAVVAGGETGSGTGDEASETAGTSTTGEDGGSAGKCSVTRATGGAGLLGLGLFGFAILGLTRRRA